MDYQQRAAHYCGEKPANRLGIASFVLAIGALGLARMALFGPVAVMGLGVIGGALGIAGLIVALSGLRSSVGFPIAGIVACGHAVIIGLVFTLGSAASMRSEASQAFRSSPTATTRPPEASSGMTGSALNTGLGERKADAYQLPSTRGMGLEPLQWLGVRAQLLRPVLPVHPQAPGR